MTQQFRIFQLATQTGQTYCTNWQTAWEMQWVFSPGRGMDGCSSLDVSPRPEHSAHDLPVCVSLWVLLSSPLPLGPRAWACSGAAAAGPRASRDWFGSGHALGLDGRALSLTGDAV